MSNLEFGDIVLPVVKNAGLQDPSLYNSTAVGGRKRKGKGNTSKKRRGGKKKKTNKCNKSRKTSRKK